MIKGDLYKWVDIVHFAIQSGYKQNECGEYIVGQHLVTLESDLHNISFILVEKDVNSVYECVYTSDNTIRKGDKFTFKHPDYPNSSIIGKVMIAETIDSTHIEKKDTEGELVVRRYPIEYCTKVK